LILFWRVMSSWGPLTQRLLNYFNFVHPLYSEHDTSDLDCPDLLLTDPTKYPTITPEQGNKSSFRNVFCSKFKTTDQVEKPSHPKSMQLTSCSQVLLDKPTVAQPLKKFLALYGNWRFITVFIRARHWSYPDESSPKPHRTSVRYSLILCSYLYLDLPSGLFPSGFPAQNQYVLLSTIHSTCCAYYILLDLVILIILVNITSQEAPYYAVCSNLLLFYPSQ
jgi:hypothetical protein